FEGLDVSLVPCCVLCLLTDRVELLLGVCPGTGLNVLEELVDRVSRYRIFRFHRRRLTSSSSDTSTMPVSVTLNILSPSGRYGLDTRRAILIGPLAARLRKTRVWLVCATMWPPTASTWLAKNWSGLAMTWLAPAQRALPFARSIPDEKSVPCPGRARHRSNRLCPMAVAR